MCIDIPVLPSSTLLSSEPPQVVIMEVHDDGRGIAPKLLDRLRTTHANGGVGLAGMWERINDLNGKLDIESSSAGTTLRVSLPLGCNGL
jgi:signal transduction histidine kinase